MAALRTLLLLFCAGELLPCDVSPLFALFAAYAFGCTTEDELYRLICPEQEADKVSTAQLQPAARMHLLPEFRRLTKFSSCGLATSLQT